jgi:hypothetical protein
MYPLRACSPALTRARAGERISIMTIILKRDSEGENE